MRLIKLLAAALIAAGAAYLWLAPGYIELDIPVARHKGGVDFWWESHRTALAYADSRGVLYVHRQVGSTSDAHTEDWKTQAYVFAFFDEQLRQRGWTAGVAGIHEPPAPESYLLGAEGTSNTTAPGRASVPACSSPSGRPAARPATITSHSPPRTRHWAGGLGNSSTTKRNGARGRRSNC